MTWKFTLRGLLALTAVVAATSAIWFQATRTIENQRLAKENQQYAEEVAALKFDLEMRRIDTLLKVPTEALYREHMPLDELHRLRWEALKDCGREDFVPLFGLYFHDPENPHPSHFGKGLEYYANYNGVFWEGYANSHADDGAARLNERLKSSQDFRNRLMADAELRDEYLKPMLIRLMRSTNQRARKAALESMLLLGDRRPEVIDTLRSDLQRLSKSPAPTLKEGRVFSSPYAQKLVLEYRQLVEEHDLEREVADVVADQQALPTP